ncbi:MAG: hypothetical protein AAF577_16190 [Pseudomonadota bacterium]
MTERDKNLYTILGAAALLALYMLALMPVTRAEIQRAEMLIGRKMNRIETRGSIPQDNAPPASASQARLETAETRLADLQGDYQSLQARFASLDSVTDVKQLRLEIAHLADWSHLAITKMGDLSGNAPADTLVALTQSAQNSYGRPILRIEAKGDFTALMTFLQGLQELNHAVAVVRMEIAAPDLTDSAGKREVYPMLTARLELTL